MTKNEMLSYLKELQEQVYYLEKSDKILIEYNMSLLAKGYLPKQLTVRSNMKKQEVKDHLECYIQAIKNNGLEKFVDLK